MNTWSAESENLIEKKFFVDKNLYLQKILCYNNIDINPLMFPNCQHEASLLPCGGLHAPCFFYEQRVLSR